MVVIGKSDRVDQPVEPMMPCPDFFAQSFDLVMEFDVADEDFRPVVDFGDDFADRLLDLFVSDDVNDPGSRFG